jgi:membrane-associated protease RseP (regulator of RpoE activity)
MVSSKGNTLVRGLTSAALASQAFGFILTALFEAGASYAILATRALPRWTGWLGIGIAVLNLAAVPAIYGGNDFMESVIAGVTTTAGVYVYINVVQGVAFIGWLIIVGISMMCVKREALAPMPHERELQEAL